MRTILLCAFLIPLTVGTEVWLKTKDHYTKIDGKLETRMIVDTADTPEVVGLGYMDYRLSGVISLKCTGVLVNTGGEAPSDIIVTSSLCISELKNGTRGDMLAVTVEGPLKIKRIRAHPEYFYQNRPFYPSTGMGVPNIKNDIGVVMLEDSKAHKLQSRFTLPEHAETQQAISDGFAAWVDDPLFGGAFTGGGNIYWRGYNTTIRNTIQTSPETCENEHPIKSFNWASDAKFCINWDRQVFPKRGSPFYTTGEEGNQFTLIGVASDAYFGKPTLFAYLPYYQQWINEKIEELHALKAQEKSEKPVLKRIIEQF